MKRRTRNIVWSLLMILALLAAPLKVIAAEQNGESSDKQQNETTEQKTEETEETAPEMTTDLGLASPSVLLMEAQTGTVLYEKNASEQRSPASITKIMTLLLIFEELEKGTLQLTDEVTTSAHARSMGGSQVFLEEGEKQTVETMIKCIVVASGNDASVAMAEHIAGTESEFVSRMNQKAKELGMNDTKFEDWPHGFRRPLHDSGRCGENVSGADRALSADPELFLYLDGRDYACHTEGKQTIHPHQYK